MSVRASVVLASMVIVVGCGGDDGGGATDARATIDGVVETDAPPTTVDAPRADAPLGDADTTCDVLTQSGCAAGQKCTWVRLSVSPPLGQPQCTPDGTVATFGACVYGPTGSTTGYDNCVEGNICLASPTVDQANGTCRPICSLFDTTAPCGSGFACGTYFRFFSNSDSETPLAGVCDPTCDPLSGTRDVDNAPFCGGPTGDPSDPASLGCYGLPSNDSDPSKFTCASQGMGEHRDVVTGQPFLNSCNSGAVPLLYESSGSTSVICVATCQPRNCNTTIRMTDPGCWRGTAPYRTTDRGCSNAGEECKYLWWFEDPSTPITALSDDVGFCVDYTKYYWDRNGDSTDGDEARWTACRNSIDTSDPNNLDADFTWGCVDTSMFPTIAPDRLPRAATRGLGLRPLGDAATIRASAARD